MLGWYELFDFQDLNFHERLVLYGLVLNFTIVNFINLHEKCEICIAWMLLQGLEFVDQVVVMIIFFCLELRWNRPWSICWWWYCNSGHENINYVIRFIKVYFPYFLVKIVIQLWNFIILVIVVIKVFDEDLSFLLRIIVVAGAVVILTVWLRIIFGIWILFLLLWCFAAKNARIWWSSFFVDIMLIAFMIIAVLRIVILISKRVKMSITRHHGTFILNKTQIRLY